MTIDESRAAENDLISLWDRPGFMIRRAHQIAQTLFLEETGSLKVTPTQYGILRILDARPGLDQIGVAKLLGQDRSTTAMVLGKLVEDGLVERRLSPLDRRRRELALTAAGQRMLVELTEPVRRSHDRLLSVFQPKDAERFLELLHQFIECFNEEARTPLDPTPRPVGVAGSPLNAGLSGAVPSPSPARTSPARRRPRSPRPAPV
ncbi:MarR family winged helix-turn-helix transcriptional regulator (plasmid) [Sphingomonas parapaucimobilis]